MKHACSIRYDVQFNEYVIDQSSRVMLHAVVVPVLILVLVSNILGMSVISWTLHPGCRVYGYIIMVILLWLYYYGYIILFVHQLSRTIDPMVELSPRRTSFILCSPLYTTTVMRFNSNNCKVSHRTTPMD